MEFDTRPDSVALCKFGTIDSATTGFRLKRINQLQYYEAQAKSGYCFSANAVFHRFLMTQTFCLLARRVHVASCHFHHGIVLAASTRTLHRLERGTHDEVQ